jgi:hypothetical protein
VRRSGWPPEGEESIGAEAYDDRDREVGAEDCRVPSPAVGPRGRRGPRRSSRHPLVLFLPQHGRNARYVLRTASRQLTEAATRLATGAVLGLALRRAYRLLASGALTLDLGRGRRLQPLGPLVQTVRSRSRGQTRLRSLCVRSASSRTPRAHRPARARLKHDRMTHTRTVVRGRGPRLTRPMLSRANQEVPHADINRPRRSSAPSV